jgi:muramoyltetrapeptide carboxypeptidase
MHEFQYTIPPFLRQGDRVAITCPAGAVLRDEMNEMIETLTHWGLEVVVGNTVGSHFGKFSAPDATRAAELQVYLDDESIKAIFFGRGGYGMVRIIDDIRFDAFCASPKWLVGYSDITCLHAQVQHQFHIASLHAHMGVAYRQQQRDDESTQSIYDILFGKSRVECWGSHPLNRVGQASGILCGGNLAMLSDMIGTPSDTDTTSTILCIEDIAEYKYNIDRMLWQLKRADKLNRLAGLVVGGFTDTQDNEIPFGMSEYEMVFEKIKEFSFPVAFDAPVGHQPRNHALLMGGYYTLTVDAHQSQLQYLSAQRKA